MTMCGILSVCNRQFQTSGGLASIAPTFVRSVESPGHRRAHNECPSCCDNSLPWVNSMWLLRLGYLMYNTIGGLGSLWQGPVGLLQHILHCSFHLGSSLNLLTMLVSLLEPGRAAERELLFELFYRPSFEGVGMGRETRIGVGGQKYQNNGK